MDSVKDIVTQDAAVLQQIRKLKSEAGLGESYLELYPGDPYWCDYLPTVHNRLKALGTLEIPSWVGEEWRAGQ
jgi:hypothetical protein